ncbi:MAG: succinate dehydrogenase, hydrophobic membrane anchor protein [Rhizobiaceae bacterium]|nr:MAG: succinate dehydrogenase, hydrophobic membrane anchor protein [Rhizobiaceae bacterium]
MGDLRVVQMIDKATISNPKTHYGNGRASTRGFIQQRVSGALNVVFTLFLVWFVVAMAGEPDATARIVLIRNPLVALALILLIVNVAVHMRIGMHDVIEDYVDHGPRNTLANTANLAFVVLVALVVIGSVVKVLFWG